MEKSGNIKLNGHIIRRIIISIFCIFIVTCVVLVMFRMYQPNQNALGALASVCMDIICMAILFIIIGSFAFGKYSANNTTRIFGVLLVATIWAMFLDFLNWAFDGNLKFGEMTFWFTLGSLCMGAVLAGIFSLYLYSYMEETHNLSSMKKHAYGCAALNAISFVLTFVLAITGTAFSFVDGHYETGSLYTMVEALPILTLAYITCYSMFNVKKIGFHDVVAVFGYISIMIAGALIESEYRIGTTYVAVSIADLFIFVMLQNEIIALEKQNVQVWMKKSNTDGLTGLSNRRAYEADLRIIADNVIAEDFIYVSADVNSLKSTNDAYGHNAGDEMLVAAAQCMEKCFSPFGRLYRIGGDEFIALINTDEEHLLLLMDKLQALTKEWKGQYVDSLTISCGYVTRTEAEDLTVKQMAELADRRMYAAKDEYYRVTGIDRRKK